jgi:GNAT superfamily N-acetyltransferase
MPNSKSPIRIRPANGGDAVALSSLAFRSKASWGYDEDFMNCCREELTYSAKQIGAPQFDFQVCTSDGEVIGFYALEQLGEETMELEAMFVEPQRIGSGVGRLLLAHAKERAGLRGARRIVIQSDPYAQPFYLAAGALLCGSRESASIAGRMLPLCELRLDEENPTMDDEK